MSGATRRALEGVGRLGQRVDPWDPTSVVIAARPHQLLEGRLSSLVLLADVTPLGGARGSRTLTYSMRTRTLGRLSPLTTLGAEQLRRNQAVGSVGGRRWLRKLLRTDCGRSRNPTAWRVTLRSRTHLSLASNPKTGHRVVRLPRAPNTRPGFAVITTCRSHRTAGRRGRRTRPTSQEPWWAIRCTAAEIDALARRRSGR